MKNKIKIGLSLLVSASLVLAGCSTMQVTSAQSTAAALATDGVSYAQTLAKAVQTINTGVQITAPLVKVVAAQWGLMPAGSSQQAIFNQVVTDVNNAGADASLVNAVLTPVNLQAVVAAVK